MIKVQKENFFLEEEVSKICAKNNNIGAISTFTGVVRNKRQDEELVFMRLDHYPQMALKMLNSIEQEAYKRWKLIDSLIIHRHGNLYPGDQIVLVITISEHRKEAINSCHFLIDWLKTKGPFWKYEKTKTKGYWVEEKEVDLIEEKKWNKI